MLSDIHLAASQNSHIPFSNLLSTCSSPGQYVSPGLFHLYYCRFHYLHLLNFMWLVIAQPYNLSRSLCKVSLLLWEPTVHPILISSANLLGFKSFKDFKSCTLRNLNVCLKLSSSRKKILFYEVQSSSNKYISSLIPVKLKSIWP